MRTVTVSWDKRGYWNIKVNCDGVRETHNRYLPKKLVIAEARVRSKRIKAELIIRNKDGRIAQKDSHGNDQRRIKG